MRLSVRHTTKYSFAQPVAGGVQRLRLKPKPTHGQQVIDWSMELGGAVPQVEYDDHHHNATALVTVEPGTRELVITCSGTVDTAGNAGVIGQHSGHIPLWFFVRQTALTKPGPRMRALVAGLGADPENRLDILHSLSDAVAEQVRYRPGTTDVATRAEDALAAGQGVCQDHAHVFIGAGRLLDIPMRYVSGYLKMDRSDGEEASHGWAEAHVDGLGWVGFDVSNTICPDDRYVRVATGCDYSEAAPMTGIAQGAGETSLEVSVSVEQRDATQQQQQGPGHQTQAQKLGSMEQQQKLR